MYTRCILCPHHTHTHFLLSSQHHQHCNIIPLGSEAAHNVILRTNMHHSLACFSRHLELCTMPLNAWPFGWFAPICSHYLFSVFLVNAFTFETLAVCETFLHSARQGSRSLSRCSCSQQPVLHRMDALPRVWERKSIMWWRRRHLPFLHFIYQAL